MKNIKKLTKRFFQFSCTLTITSLLASACTDNNANSSVQTNKTTSVNNEQDNHNLSASNSDQSNQSNNLEKSNAKEQIDSANPNHAGAKQNSEVTDSKNDGRGHDQAVGNEPTMTGFNDGHSMNKKGNEEPNATHSEVTTPSEQEDSSHPPSEDNNEHTEANPDSTTNQSKGSPPSPTKP